jgi:ApbE superfamily uncharacterized protein (UPF0280 family)
MPGAVAALLADGRLHLQHGPIDLIIGADGDRDAAFAAARARFCTVLEELVAELPLLRRAVGARPKGRIARRMHDAVRPHGAVFVTPMAAVAGAVAEEVLGAMVAAAPLTRAYVNNGGDIALHLTGAARFRMAIAGLDNTRLGTIDIAAADPVRGVATSGQRGRSLSLGIADAVTVLAGSAAAADVAATLIANAVDLPRHPTVRRTPARDIDPDSDLGARLVVTHVGPLTADAVAKALSNGARLAQDMRQRGLIDAAALFLRGQSCLVGPNFLQLDGKIPQHA